MLNTLRRSGSVRIRQNQARKNQMLRRACQRVLREIPSQGLESLEARQMLSITLPNGWISEDIGTPEVMTGTPPVVTTPADPSMQGGARMMGENIEVWGSGSDIWGNVDHFQFTHFPSAITGDASIEAMIKTWANNDTQVSDWQKAGVMFRGGLANNAAQNSLFVTGKSDTTKPNTPGAAATYHGIANQWRPYQGSASLDDTPNGSRAWDWNGDGIVDPSTETFDFLKRAGTTLRIDRTGNAFTYFVGIGQGSGSLEVSFSGSAAASITIDKQKDATGTAWALGSITLDAGGESHTRTYGPEGYDWTLLDVAYSLASEMNGWYDHDDANGNPVFMLPEADGVWTFTVKDPWTNLYSSPDAMPDPMNAAVGADPVLVGGITWLEWYTRVLPYVPNAMVPGLAVTSHDNGAPTATPPRAADVTTVEFANVKVTDLSGSTVLQSPIRVEALPVGQDDGSVWTQINYWDMSSNETGFRIERMGTGTNGQWVPVAAKYTVLETSPDPNDPTKTITELKTYTATGGLLPADYHPGINSATIMVDAPLPGSHFEYRVVALNGGIEAASASDVVDEPVVNLNAGLAVVQGGVPGQVDLTKEGNTDWVALGMQSGNPGFVVRNAGVTPRIANIQHIWTDASQPEVNETITDIPAGFNWTNGDGAYRKVSNEHNGLRTNFPQDPSGQSGYGIGYSFDVPADTYERKLTVYVAAQNANGRLEAELSDQSQVPVIASFGGGSAAAPAVIKFTIYFKAGSDNQTLHVRWVKTGDVSNDMANQVGYVDLVAISLSGGPAEAPKVFENFANDGAAALTWLPGAGAMSYTIYRQDPDTGTWSEAGKTTNTFFVDSGLTNGKTYKYKVTSSNALGDSADESAIQTVTPNPQAPPVPAAPAVDTSTIPFVISWEPVFFATSYTVKRAESPAGPFVAVPGGSGLTTTKFVDASVTGGKMYYYVVSATVANFESANSQVSNGMIGNGRGLLGQYWTSDSTRSFGGSPILTRVDPQIAFFWGDGGGAAQMGINSPASNVSVNQFTARWEGLVEAQHTEAYTFYPRTDDGARLWVWPDGQPMPATPLVNRWVDRGTTEDTSSPVQLEIGVKYRIRMEFYENGGSAAAQLRWSSPSTPKQLIPRTQLYVAPEFSADAPSAAPGSVAATAVSPYAIKIDWQDLATNELAYLVQRSTSANGPFADVAVLAPSANPLDPQTQLPLPVSRSFFDTRLNPDTQYFYKVVAFTSTDLASAVVSARTEASTAVGSLNNSVLYLPGDIQADGLTVTDASGFDNNGTIVNVGTVNITSVPGKSGNALSFPSPTTGQNPSVVRIPFDASNPVKAYAMQPRDAITIGVWVRFESNGNRRIVQQGEGDPSFTNATIGTSTNQTAYQEMPYRLLLESNQIRFQLQGAAGIPTDAVTAPGVTPTGTRAGTIPTIADLRAPMPTIGSDAWHYIAGTYDGSVVRLYIDGALASQTTASGPLYQSTKDILIGAKFSNDTGNIGDRMHGEIDELRIYDRALSELELLSVYPGNAAPKSPVTLTVSNNQPKRLVLNWTLANDAATTGYELWRKDDQTNAWSMIQRLEGYRYNYTDTDVLGGVQYTYRLRSLNVGAGLGAVDAEGNPAYSPEASGIPSGDLPSGWIHQDIGAVGAAGDAGYIVNKVNGQDVPTFQLLGSGADVWGTADEHHYAYQKVVGDVTVTARVASMVQRDNWTKAGVMVRNTLDANSAGAETLLAASNGNGLNFQWRATAGTDKQNPQGRVSASAPQWVRLKRVGNWYVGERSSDGVAWYEINRASFNTPETVYAGIFLTSHNDGQIAEAVFDNVSIKTYEEQADNPVLVGTVADRAAVIKWDAVGGAAGYEIWRQDGPNGTWTKLVATPTQTGLTLSYTDSGLTNGSEYFYKVVATSKYGQPGVSNVVRVVPRIPGTGLSVTYYNENAANNDFTGVAIASGSTGLNGTIARSPNATSDFAAGTYADVNTDYFVNFNFDNFTDDVPDANMKKAQDPTNVGIRKNDWSAIWQGWLYPDTTDDYQFIGRSDDTMRIYVDNKLMTSGTWNSNDVWSSKVRLTQGQVVPIRVEYQQGGGGQYARVRWANSTMGMTPIPRANLYPLSVAGNSGYTPATPLPTAVNDLAGGAGANSAILAWKDRSATETATIVQFASEADNFATWANLNTLPNPDDRGLGWFGPTPNTVPVVVSMTVPGLAANTRYKFRIVQISPTLGASAAQNGGNGVVGNVIEIKTGQNAATAVSGSVLTLTDGTTVNLTDEGGYDWAHWGLGGDVAAFNTAVIGAQTGGVWEAAPGANYVALEAESAIVTDPDSDGRTWKVITTRSTPSATGGNGAPSGGAALFSDRPFDNTPSQAHYGQYKMKFDTKGDYYLYVRRRAIDGEGDGAGDNDSFSPGRVWGATPNIDNNNDWNSLTGNGTRISGGDNNWNWAGNTNWRVNVPNDGMTVDWSIAIRESYYAVDRFIWSKTPNLNGNELNFLANSMQVGQAGTQRQRPDAEGPITDFVAVGTGTATAFAGTSPSFNWSNGAPVASNSGATGGVQVSGVGNGFKFTVPADQNPRRLRVYVAAENAKGTLTASSDDGSGLTYTGSLDATGAGLKSGVFTIDITAAAANKLATIEYKLESGSGSVALLAAAWDDTSLPAAPVGLTLVPGMSRTNTLMWSDQASNEEGYVIRRSMLQTDGSWSGWTDAGKTAANALTFRDGGLTPGATYKYQVSAFNRAGESAALTTGTVTQDTLPEGWKSQDVTDNPFMTPGDVGYDEAQDMFIFQGNGSDIWNNNDQGNLAYLPLNGDGGITARILFQENTDGWAKSGVEIRESTGANSRHLMVAATPGNGLTMQGRQNTGGGSSEYKPYVTGAAAPAWLRVQRQGQVLVGWASTDGVNWQQIGNPLINIMSPNALIGLISSSHNTGRLGVVAFDNVSIVNPFLITPAAPAGLATAARDGMVDLTWQASYGASSYTIKRAATAGGPYEVIATGVTGQAYGDTTASATNDNFYVVVAENVAGTSADSVEVSGKAGAALASLDFSGGFANTNGLTLNDNAARQTANYVRLTEASNSKRGSMFTNDRRNITTFRTTFDYQTSKVGNQADGFTFAIQRYAANFLGNNGGQLGFQGYAPSVGGNAQPQAVAIRFNIYQAGRIGLLLDGRTDELGQTVVDTNPPVDLRDGKVKRIEIAYANEQLAVTITEPTSGAVRTDVFNVDLVQWVGSAAAHVGFTAGTGGDNAEQKILNWTFSNTAPAALALGTDGDDVITLKRNGANVDVFTQGAEGPVLAQSLAYAQLGAVSLGGGAGNDTFVLDLSGGAITTQLAIDGGEGANAVKLVSGAGGKNIAISDTQLNYGSSVALANIGSFVLDSSGSDVVNVSGTVNLAVNGNLNRLTAIDSSVVNFAASSTMSDLTVRNTARVALAADGSRFLKTNNLTLSDTAVLVLNDNDLIVSRDNAGNRDSALNAIVGFIKNGLTNNTTAPQILSSGSADQTTGLGAVPNVNTLGGALYSAFAGQTVNNNAVLVKYTYGGDADLNGVVDASDFFRANRGEAKGLKGWLNGDANYDNVVDLADYSIIDRGFLASTAPGASALGSVFGLKAIK